MAPGGLLLTGGASRRMGEDKATIKLPGDSETLAQRTARMLGAVTAPTMEVGPGRSRLRRVVEPAGPSGPLRALARGYQELRSIGWEGAVIVLATDLPLLSGEFLAWLAAYPSRSSVIPVAEGRAQPLCARYCSEDLATAAALVSGGHSAMRDLVSVIDAEMIAEEEWPSGANTLTDADTPEELAAAVGIATSAVGVPRSRLWTAHP
jgi:molybdopterin-guanine dinucleotide biosynthesis protein A